MKNCPNCGRQLSDVARFCNKCGQKIAVPAAVAPGPPPAPAVPVSSAPAPALVHVPAEVSADSETITIASSPAPTQVVATRPEHLAVDALLKDRYLLVRKVKDDIIGPVWHATNRTDGKPVALWILDAAVAMDEKAMVGIKQAAKKAQPLEHRSVLKLHSLETDPFPFLVTDATTGETLDGVFAPGGAGSLEPVEIDRLLQELAPALDHAHSKGVLHRAIQPATIERRERGAPAALMHFGVAAEIRDSAAMRERADGLGLPVYAAPEQMAMRSVDARTDVYSLAVTLYHLMTGQHPFSTESQLISAPSERIQLESEALTLVLTRAMSRKGDKRYASAGELATAFRAALQAPPPAAAVKPPAGSSLVHESPHAMIQDLQKRAPGPAPGRIESAATLPPQTAAPLPPQSSALPPQTAPAVPLTPARPAVPATPVIPRGATPVVPVAPPLTPVASVMPPPAVSVAPPVPVAPPVAPAVPPLPRPQPVVFAPPLAPPLPPPPTVRKMRPFQALNHWVELSILLGLVFIIAWNVWMLWPNVQSYLRK